MSLIIIIIWLKMINLHVATNKKKKKAFILTVVPTITITQ